MKWCDVQIGSTVVSTTSRTTCTLLNREERTYTWFIVDSEDFDFTQRPGSVHVIVASGHEEEIEGWVVFR